MDMDKIAQYVVAQIKPTCAVVEALQVEGGYLEQLGAQIKSAADRIATIKNDAPKMDTDLLKYYIKR